MATTTNEDALNALEKLINSDGEVSLPGLDLDTIADNFVEAKYGSELSSITNETEREELRKKWQDYYKNGEGKEMLTVEIDNIKAQFGAAQAQLDNVTTAAASAVASNSIPAVLTVGSATSTPNPAYTIIENKTKKNQLQATLKSVEGNLASLLKSAITVCFPVPAAVTSLISTLATAKKTVNSIPV